MVRRHYDPSFDPEYEDDNDGPGVWPCGKVECETCHDRFMISHPDDYPEGSAKLRATRPDLKDFEVMPSAK